MNILWWSHHYLFSSTFWHLSNYFSHLHIRQVLNIWLFTHLATFARTLQGQTSNFNVSICGWSCFFVWRIKLILSLNAFLRNQTTPLKVAFLCGCSSFMALGFYYLSYIDALHTLTKLNVSIVLWYRIFSQLILYYIFN